MSLSPLEWCRQRLLVPGNPMVITLNFAAPEHRDRILALRTVATELAIIPSEVSDESVALNKLAWWQQALGRADESAHPAILALHETGAAARIPAASWQQMFQGVEESIHGPRFERFEELMAHCDRVGGSLFALEHIALDGGGEVAPWRQLGASGYLYRVVRDLALDARQQRWMVPLDLQAYFQIDRRQAVEGTDSMQWRALVREMVGRGSIAARQARDTISRGTAWRQRHLMVCAALEERLGRLVARRPTSVLQRRMLPGRFGNLWTAWRTATRLNRQRMAE